MVKRILFLVSIFIFGYHLYLLIIGGYNIDLFDGALHLAAINYMKAGLIPYRDFAMVYPPGFMLLAKYLPADMLVERYFWYAALYAGFVGAIGLLIYMVGEKEEEIYIELILIFLANSLLIYFFGKGGAFVYLIEAVSVFLTVAFLRGKVKDWVYVVAAGLSFMVGVWFRWDWLLALVLVCWAGIVVGGKKIFIVGLGATTGYLLGAVLLIGYLSRLGVIREAWEFVVVIPLYLTRTYRDLPLPFPGLPIDPSFIFYVSVAFMVWMVVIIISRLVELYKSGEWEGSEAAVYIILAGYVVSFLPYALGRSDWWHFIALWYAVINSWVLTGLVIGRLGDFKRLAVLAAFLPVLGWYVRGIKDVGRGSNFGEKVVQAQIKECREAVKDYEVASVFVGRESYQRYLFNVAALYLIYPQIKPATKFIAEEPGIQNTCEYGERVADELARAERPMLAYLEEGIHAYDNQLTRDMESCGKIEEYLGSAKYEAVGRCVAYGFPFKVRIYE